MSDTSDESRAIEVRSALARLRDDLAGAGIDLADPRARSLVTAYLAEGAVDGDRRAGPAITAAAKRVMAYEMRIEGKTYREIARRLGWKSDNSARRAISKSVADMGQLLAEPIEVRTVLIERMEAMWRGLAPKAMGGDAVAVRAALKIFAEMRHIIPGLDLLRSDAADRDVPGVMQVIFHLPEWDFGPHDEAKRDAIEAKATEGRALPVGS